MDAPPIEVEENPPPAPSAATAGAGPSEGGHQ
jgi:hypothetical protein